MLSSKTRTNGIQVNCSHHNIQIQPGNENGEETTIGLISKKATLHVQHTFFSTFLFRCFAKLQLKTPRNFLVTCFIEEMQSVFLLPFIHCRSLSPRWPLAFFIFSPPLQNFHVVVPTKKCLLCFFLSLQLSVALFLVELRWPVAYTRRKNGFTERQR